MMIGIIVLINVISVSIAIVVVYKCAIDFNHCDCDLCSGVVITAITISSNVIFSVDIFINIDVDADVITFYLFGYSFYSH